MKNKSKMNAKKLMVSFLAVASLLLVATSVSAADFNSVLTKVDGVNAEHAAIVAGDTIVVEVSFDSGVNASDVTIEVELEGEKADVEAETKSFDVEEGFRYIKVLTLKVPYELKDQLSEDAELTVEISGRDVKSVETYDLRIQRESYNANVMSVVVDQNIAAGETFPVDVVLKNVGYNDLDDVYVTVSMPELGLQKSAYFGDIVSLECDEDDSDVENYGVDVNGDRDRRCNEDDQDTVSGRLYLKMPYAVKTGAYTLEVSVSNDDAESSVAKQITVSNTVESEIVVGDSRESVAAGEEAMFDLLLINPTDQVKVYRIVTESTSGLSSGAETSVVAVPAGSSKNVKIVASADEEGEYEFNVNVFSGESLVGTAPMTVEVEGSKMTSPTVILTVILAIIFIVLLIVLIVLIAKKPERSEEFGESYY